MRSLSSKKVYLSTCVLLVFIALGFRLFVALRLPNDAPEDGRVYAQIARNVLEHQIYSHDSSPPYSSSLIRLPGYPLFLASLYAISGHSNNTAVRVSQAVIDTATCMLIALLAFEWTSDEKWKPLSASFALMLAAICPFTTIYVATILTEVPTSFLAVGQVLAATRAFKSVGRRAVVWWMVAGLLAGLGVLFRPDSGLFTAAIGLTIFIGVCASSGTLTSRFARAVLNATLLSVTFCMVLLPWAIRNQRVFHQFQPLAPSHGEMPGEFVPRGYLLWVRTWMHDGRYVGPTLWALDTQEISINSFPESAFDSKDERDRVTSLLEKYNHSNSEEEATTSQTEDEEDSSENELEPQTAGDADVEMTPEIDAAFAQLGRERAARAPLRYFVVLPLKRAVAMWFDTHSQYYPFEGELLPLEDLDFNIKQHIWLPLFTGLTWVYSLLGLAGVWILLRSKETAARRWSMLVGLIIALRIGFFSTLENPEPRYVVEVFPFLAALGGVAIARLVGRRLSSVTEDKSQAMV